MGAEWSTAFDVYGGMGLNGYGLAAKAAAGGFAGSFVGSGGNAKAGLQGAATGAAFSWAGGIGGTHDPSRYAAHAAVGCGSGIMNGSGCAEGAAAAVAGHATAGGGIVVSVVAGGTVSAIGGGKFANGAVTAGFGYLFNHWAHNLALAVDGIEAHQTLQQQYGWRSGYAVETSEIPGTGQVDGRFDIARSDGALWEIKRNSVPGRLMGEAALADYTNGTGFYRGGNLPDLPVGGSMTLDGVKGSGIYRYTNVGGGLIVYDRIGSQPSSGIRINVPSPFILPGRRPTGNPF